MIVYVVAGIAAWVSVGVLAAGLTVGDFVQSFPRLDSKKHRAEEIREWLCVGMLAAPGLLFSWFIKKRHPARFILTTTDAPEKDYYDQFMEER